MDETGLRSGLSPYGATTTTTGQEPLVVDLTFAAQAGFHWVAERIVFVSNLVTRAPNSSGVPPITGLYLCPPGTRPESLTDAQASWNPAARPIPLPLNDPYLNYALVNVSGVTQYALMMVLAPGQRVTVPYGWFLRAIVTCEAGQASPGPGTGSTGTLTALMTQERDGSC